MQETTESTVRVRVYYDYPYVCVQVVGLSLFHQPNRIDYFPSDSGAAAAWDQQKKEGDLISYVWGSFESLETWTRLYKCKALPARGISKM